MNEQQTFAPATPEQLALRYMFTSEAEAYISSNTYNLDPTRPNTTARVYDRFAGGICVNVTELAGVYELVSQYYFTDDRGVVIRQTKVFVSDGSGVEYEHDESYDRTEDATPEELGDLLVDLQSAEFVVPYVAPLTRGQKVAQFIRKVLG